MVVLGTAYVVFRDSYQPVNSSKVTAWATAAIAAEQAGCCCTQALAETTYQQLCARFGCAAKTDLCSAHALLRSNLLLYTCQHPMENMAPLPSACVSMLSSCFSSRRQR